MSVSFFFNFLLKPHFSQYTNFSINQKFFNKEKKTTFSSHNTNDNLSKYQHKQPPPKGSASDKTKSLLYNPHSNLVHSSRRRKNACGLARDKAKHLTPARIPLALYTEYNDTNVIPELVQRISPPPPPQSPPAHSLTPACTRINTVFILSLSLSLLQLLPPPHHAYTHAITG